MVDALRPAPDVLAVIEQLVPGLDERAQKAEDLRQLPPDTIDDASAGGLFRMVVPTSLGGDGHNVVTLAHATRAMAHGCVSSAWTLSFLVMHNWLLTRFPAEARDEFFGGADPWALAPAPLAPTGTFTDVDGGIQVTGAWEWATGVQHADWVMVHALDPETFSTCFVAVPIEDCEVDDVWHTAGMRGTGSNTVRLDDIHVPHHRTLAAHDMLFGADSLDGDGMAGLPVPQVLALVAAAPALGAAQRAVQLYRERVAHRVLAYSLGDKAVEQPAAQMRLGAVMSEIDAATLRWETAVDEVARHTGGVEMSLDRRAAIRLAASDTVRRSRAIIHAIAEGAGASVYFTDAPFQRLQRDVEVLKGHVIFDWDRTTELAGKVALGIEPGPADMI